MNGILGFTLEIPMELDPNPPAASEQREETLTLNGLRILLVEDNDLNLEIAQYLLAHAGASVDTAHNGKAAVKKFLEAPVGYYDIILMDVMAPAGCFRPHHRHDRQRILRRYPPFQGSWNECASGKAD